MGVSERWSVCWVLVVWWVVMARCGCVVGGWGVCVGARLGVGVVFGVASTTGWLAVLFVVAVACTAGWG